MGAYKSRFQVNRSFLRRFFWPLFSIESKLSGEKMVLAPTGMINPPKSGKQVAVGKHPGAGRN